MNGGGRAFYIVSVVDGAIRFRVLEIPAYAGMTFLMIGISNTATKGNQLADVFTDDVKFEVDDGTLSDVGEIGVF